MILFYSPSDPLPKGLRMELQSVAGGARSEGGWEKRGVVCVGLWVCSWTTGLWLDGWGVCLCKAKQMNGGEPYSRYRVVTSFRENPWRHPWRWSKDVSLFRGGACVNCQSESLRIICRLSLPGPRIYSLQEVGRITGFTASGWGGWWRLQHVTDTKK